MQIVYDEGLVRVHDSWRAWGREEGTGRKGGQGKGFAILMKSLKICWHLWVCWGVANKIVKFGKSVFQPRPFIVYTIFRYLLIYNGARFATVSSSALGCCFFCSFGVCKRVGSFLKSWTNKVWPLNWPRPRFIIAKRCTPLSAQTVTTAAWKSDRWGVHLFTTTKGARSTATTKSKSKRMRKSGKLETRRQSCHCQEWET